jgi:hypothetical protein
MKASFANSSAPYNPQTPFSDLSPQRLHSPNRISEANHLNQDICITYDQTTPSKNAIRNTIGKSQKSAKSASGPNRQHKLQTIAKKKKIIDNSIIFNTIISE